MQCQVRVWHVEWYVMVIDNNDMYVPYDICVNTILLMHKVHDNIFKRKKKKSNR